MFNNTHPDWTWVQYTGPNGAAFKMVRKDSAETIAAAAAPPAIVLDDTDNPADLMSRKDLITIAATSSLLTALAIVALTIAGVL